MKLTECEKGKKYVVCNVTVKKETESRLHALGLIQGSYIEVINKKCSGSMIVRIRGTRFAFGKDIAEGITVEGVRKNG